MVRCRWKSLACALFCAAPSFGQDVDILGAYVRGFGSAYRVQALEIRNRAATNVDALAFALNAGGRVKPLKNYFGTGTNRTRFTDAQIRARFVAPGGTALVMDRGYAGEAETESAFGGFASRPVLTVADASLGAGVFLKPGETIRLQDARGRSTEFAIPPTDRGAPVRRIDTVRLSFTTSLSPHLPPPVWGASADRLLLVRESGGPLWPGAPEAAELRATDAGGAVDETMDGVVDVAVDADLDLVPIDESIPAVRTGGMSRLPLRAGRTSLFYLVARRQGPLRFEAVCGALARCTERIFARHPASGLRVTAIRARGDAAFHRLETDGSAPAGAELRVFSDEVLSRREWPAGAWGTGPVRTGAGQGIELYSAGSLQIRQDGRILEAVAWESPGSSLPESTLFRRKRTDLPALGAGDWRVEGAPTDDTLEVRAPAAWTAGTPLGLRVTTGAPGVLEARLYDRAGTPCDARSAPTDGSPLDWRPDFTAPRAGLAFLKIRFTPRDASLPTRETAVPVAVPGEP